MLRLCQSAPLYRNTRSLHLYFGLFVSPLLLVFATSVLIINHSHPVSDQHPVIHETKVIQWIPTKLDSLDSVRAIMEQADLSGWVTLFRLIKEKNQFRFILLRPTVRKDVTLDLQSGKLEIQNKPNDWKQILYWLHTFPGPHVQLRDWFFLSVWSILTDTLVYVILFLSSTGIYLWLFLRRERRTGLVLITCGLAWFLVSVGLVLT